MKLNDGESEQPSAVCDRDQSCFSCVTRRCSSAANSCVLPSRDNWLWRHFPWTFSHILCLYFQWSSSHVAPTRDKCCFCRAFCPYEQLSAAPRGALLPRQVHVGCQGSEKWAFQVERQFSLQSTDNFRYHCGKKKKKRSPSVQRIRARHTCVLCLPDVCT